MPAHEVTLMLPALLVAGAVAGVSAGLFGVGGGFVVVPAMLFILGLLPEVVPGALHLAIGTSLATIVFTSLRSIQAHHRRGVVDFAILRDWAPWLALGVVLGLAVAAVANTAALLLVFAVGVLLYAVYFLAPPLTPVRAAPMRLPGGVRRAALASGLGGFSALLGIGGGTPFVVTMVVCGRSVHEAVATAAGVGFLIAVPGAVGFMLLGLGQSGLPAGSLGFVSLPAVIAISLVSMLTAPLGARWAHSMSEARLRQAFGVYLLFISLTMFDKYLTQTIA